jgi:hypothetical protein
MPKILIQQYLAENGEYKNTLQGEIIHFLSISEITHGDVEGTYIRALRENIAATKKSNSWQNEQGAISDFSKLI